MGGKKSPPPAPAPVPTVTQVAEKPREPIQRNATSANAQDRAASNTSAELLAAAPEDDATKKAQASMMG